MTAPQPTPFQIRTSAQADALLDFSYGARLLEKFTQPSTSSQAARALAEPANRVAYHVRKLTETGLLRVAERQGKRVLYQVVAQVFHVPRAFVRLDDPPTLIEPAMREITTAYAHAVLEWQARRDTVTPDGDGSHLLVHLGGTQDDQDDELAKRPAGPYAPGMRMRSVRVTSQQYRKVQDALDRVLTELATDAEDAQDTDSSAQKSTFVVMGFLGGLHDA